MKFFCSSVSPSAFWFCIRSSGGKRLSPIGSWFFGCCCCARTGLQRRRKPQRHKEHKEHKETKVLFNSVSPLQMVLYLPEALLNPESSSVTSRREISTESLLVVSNEISIYRSGETSHGGGLLF